jgi:MscS family membrane protein
MKKDFCIKSVFVSFVLGILLSNSASTQDTVPDSLAQSHRNILKEVAPAAIESDSFTGEQSQDTTLVNSAESDSQFTGAVFHSQIKEPETLIKSEQPALKKDDINQKYTFPAVIGQTDTILQKTHDGDAAKPKIKSLQEILSTSKLFLSLFVFAAGWIFLRYLTKLLNIFSERWPQYRLTIKGLIPVIRIGSWTLILFFIIVAIIQPAIATIWTITASAGIAIGFASQDILKNIFGGILILMDKPFKVGDKIQIEAYYGEVVNIGLRTVRIVTPDDSLVSIPNSEIVNKSVSNANAGAPDCQVVAEFYFEKDMDMNRAHTLAVRCASISRYVFLNKPITATFKNEIYEGRSMIKMRLKAYVFDHRFEYAFITEMSKIVFREFPKAGLNI